MSQMYIYNLSITAEQKRAWTGLDDFCLQMLNTCYPFFSMFLIPPFAMVVFQGRKGAKKVDYEGCVALAFVCVCITE